MSSIRPAGKSHLTVAALRAMRDRLAANERAERERIVFLPWVGEAPGRVRQLVLSVRWAWGFRSPL